MRRLALVGSVALGCSAVNPLFNPQDGGASGDEDVGFQAEVHRGVAEIAGDGDLAPVEDANGLLLMAGPNTAFYVPLDAEQPIVAQNITGTMAATLQVTGLALSVSGDYWASSGIQLWHIAHDPPMLMAEIEPSYVHVGATLNDLAAVYPPPEECEAMHTLVGER